MIDTQYSSIKNLMIELANLEVDNIGLQVKIAEKDQEIKALEFEVFKLKAYLRKVNHGE